MGEQEVTLNKLFELVSTSATQQNTAIQELRQEIKTNNDLYQQLTARLDGITSKIDTLNARVTATDNRCDVIDADLDETRNEVNAIQQQLLKNHLVFKGVPELEYENDVLLKSAILAVLGKINIRLDPNTFTVKRIGIKRANSSRVVMFCTDTHGVTQGIIAAKRKISIKVKEIIVNGRPLANEDDNTSIFIDEQLTAKTRELLEYAKTLKDDGYKFVWVKDGRIFVKEKEDKKPVPIKSAQDVEKLSKKRSIDDESQAANKRVRTRSQHSKEQQRYQQQLLSQQHASQQQQALQQQVLQQQNQAQQQPNQLQQLFTQIGGVSGNGVGSSNGGGD